MDFLPVWDNIMAREPSGSENWPVLDASMGAKRHRDSDTHPEVPCYWSNHGHEHESFGVRARKGSQQKYRDNYDNIRWDDD